MRLLILSLVFLVGGCSAATQIPVETVSSVHQGQVETSTLGTSKVCWAVVTTSHKLRPVRVRVFFPCEQLGEIKKFINKRFPVEKVPSSDVKVVTVLKASEDK